jgi:hypothetical protein
MIRRPAALVHAIVMLSVVAAAFGACGGAGGSKTATPAQSPPAGTAAVTPGATATSSVGIRTLDLSTVADVQGVIAGTGGQYVQAGVIYADLTGDGVDDALVPISSGGTMGDIAFLVLAPSGGETKTLLKEIPLGGSGGLSVAVVDGQIVMTQPVYGPNDPNCCPSALRKTTYVWNGSAFAVQSVTTDVNPTGGGKTTPSAQATVARPPGAPSQ